MYDRRKGMGTKDSQIISFISRCCVVMFLLCPVRIDFRYPGIFLSVGYLVQKLFFKDNYRPLSNGTLCLYRLDRSLFLSLPPFIVYFFSPSWMPPSHVTVCVCVTPSSRLCQVSLEHSHTTTSSVKIFTYHSTYASFGFNQTCLSCYLRNFSLSCLIFFASFIID